MTHQGAFVCVLDGSVRRKCLGAIVIIQPIKWRRKLELTVRGGKAGQMEVGHQDFSKDFQISWEISTIICIALSSREQAIPKSILSNYFLPKH